MKRNLLLAALLLLLLPLSLFAESYYAVWEWELDDPNVTAFRYQLNGEEPDNWTEVAADVNQYKLLVEDEETDLVLYVQSSYDGLNWSQSTASNARPEVVTAETAATETATTASSKSGRWYVSNTIGMNVLAGSWDNRNGNLASTTLAANARLGIVDKVTAGYQFNDWFRLSLSAGFAYQFSKNLSTNGYMYIPVTVNTDFRIAKIGPVDLWTQLSVGMYDRIFGKQYQLGPMAGLGIYAEYAVTENFLLSAGVALNTYLTHYNSFKGLEILLEVTPVYLTCTYMF